MTQEQKILLALVEQDVYYDTEYDGRVYSCCRYCDSDIGATHEYDCLYLAAFDAVSDILYKKKTDEVAYKVNKAFESDCLCSHSLFKRKLHNILKKMRTKYVKCDRCGKKVSEEGINEHKRSNACSDRVARAAKQTSIRKCLNCGNGIDHLHKNAKFCSNKGIANCKDRYYNKAYKR